MTGPRRLLTALVASVSLTLLGTAGTPPAGAAAHDPAPAAPGS